MSRFHTPADLAAMLDTTPVQVLEWRRQYGWPSVKIGKTIRFTDEHVEQIIAKHTATPKASEVDATAAGVVLTGQTKRSARRSA